MERNPLSDDGQQSILHNEYRAFHEFAREMRSKYPMYTRLIQQHDTLDATVFNSLVTES